MNEDQELEFEKMFDHLPLDSTPDEARRASLRDRVLAAQTAEIENQSKPNQIVEIGRLLMKYKIPHWTSLAAGIAWMVFALQFSSPALAVEEVLRKLALTKSATYDIVTQIGNQSVRTKVYQSEGVVREETGDMVTLRDLTKHRTLFLNKRSKQATYTRVTTKATESPAKKSAPTDFFASMISLLKSKGAGEMEIELLDAKEVDGEKLAGFRITITDLPVTIWADPKTQTPKRFEFQLGSVGADVVLANFDADTELDDALFRFDIPEGYTLEETSIDASKLPDEDDLLRTFRLSIEGPQKAFPASLGISALSEGTSAFTQRLIARDDGKVDMQKLQREVVEYTRGFTFAMIMQAANDAHYAGKDAKAGDASAPIFWYKQKPDSKYRVIYADLSVKEADAAPEVAGAEAVGVR